MTAPAIDRDTVSARELQAIEALLKSGRAADALDRAHELFTDERTPPWRIADLCKLAATAAQAVGMVPLAEEMWRQAAAHASDASDAANAHVNLGVLLANLGRNAEAIASLRRAIELDESHVQALANLAVLLGAKEHALEAEGLYGRALALDPANVVAHTNLGLLLQAAERLDDAEHHLRRAIALAPGNAAIHSNLGNLLAQRGQEDEAESLLQKALEIDPVWAPAHCSIGVLLADLRRDAEAELHLRRAIELRPGYPLAQLDLSCLLLAQGRFSEAWPLHESRHDPALIDNGIPPPNVELPRWRGEPLAGKRLLVWPEQGLGDQIMFCRYLPLLKSMGASHITLVCQRPLLRLFQTLAGADAVLAADIIDNAFHVDAAKLGAHDFWIFPLSLPALLHTDLSTLPHTAIPYLRATRDSAAQWAARLNSDARYAAADMRVGLVWRGNPRHNNDAHRSLPGLETLAALWTVPGVRFVSLQTGSAGAQAQSLKAAQPVLHVGGELNDFAQTAAVLDSLDLLICVDTSIAHLAGAMGKPCWVLLPHRKTDWRWLRERDDSPWYPVGMTLFRQAARGDWAGVVERVRASLAQRADQHRARPREKDRRES